MQEKKFSEKHVKICPAVTVSRKNLRIFFLVEERLLDIKVAGSACSRVFPRVAGAGIRESHDQQPLLLFTFEFTRILYFSQYLLHHGVSKGKECTSRSVEYHRITLNFVVCVIVRVFELCCIM